MSQRLLPREEGKGRIAAVEIMLNTPLVGDMIFKGEVGEIKELMKRSRELGMQTFDQALFDLYEDRHVSYEDALRNADSVNDLRLQIKLNSSARAQPGPVGRHRAPDDRLSPNGWAARPPSTPRSPAKQGRGLNWRPFPLRLAMKTYEPTPSRKTAFLGLGVMGHPMAGHLARAGHEVCVFNRTAAKAQAWAKEYGGRSAPTPREAAAGADFVFCCVGNDDDLRSVVLGEHGAFAGMKPGAVFVDHTTASAAVARELYAAAKAKGLQFIDAPVSGGQAGAVNGMLTVMCGGDSAPFDAMKPVAMAFSRAVTLVGAAAPASWPRW